MSVRAQPDGRTRPVFGKPHRNLFDGWELLEESLDLCRPTALRVYLAGQQVIANAHDRERRWGLDRLLVFVLEGLGENLDRFVKHPVSWNLGTKAERPIPKSPVVSARP